MKTFEFKPQVIRGAAGKPKVKPRPIRGLDPPAPDPLEDVPDTGSVQQNALAELDAIQTGFMRRLEKERERTIGKFDTEYWLCVIFETREQKEHFLAELDIQIEEGDKYVDGYVIAKRLRIKLPDSPIDWSDRRANRTKRN
jgi:hypothetical protein